MLPFFTNFLFPHSCYGCGKIMASSQQYFCVSCNLDREFTYWKWNQPNIMYNEIHSLVSIESAVALLYFKKGNSTQKLLHLLKYKNHQDLGKVFAEELYRMASFQDISLDAVVAVPIHAQKLKIRGYNQVETFGRKLSQILKVPYRAELLKRVRHQTSQTQSSRNQRLERLEGTFSLNLPHSSTSLTHILLVDDVCTSGATLINCSRLFVERKIKVSIATVAFTYG